MSIVRNYCFHNYIECYRSCYEYLKTVLILCRNLSLGGGPDVCIKMVEQDVMTPLTTFVRQVQYVQFTLTVIIIFLL